MTLAGRRVAVVGAGIAGLAAAVALGRRGAEVTVLEQATALREVGAGLQIAPNGVAVLDALGLRAAAEPAASRPEAIELADHRTGRTVARIPLGADCLRRYGRPYWQFHRADLLALLAEAAVAAGVAIRLGTRVEAVEPAPPGVRLLAGTGAEAADLCIAADGIRSAVRAAHFEAPSPRFTGHVAWRGLVPAAELDEPASVTRVTMAPGRHLVSYPLRGGRLVNFVAVEERARWVGEGWMAPADPAELARAFAGWGGAAGRLVASVRECFLWGLFDHPPFPAWTKGRIALIGDACHPMLPFLAQGATMALEDAWVLAACLDAHPDPAAGLAAYARARIGRTARVQRAAATSGRLYHLPAGARDIAYLGLGLVSRFAPGRLAGRFNWIFGEDVTSIQGHWIPEPDPATKGARQ